MKKILFLILIVGAISANAAPFVVSDPTAQTVTHCGVKIDSLTAVDSPVASDTTGKYCKYDLSGLAAGTHIIKATYVNIDPTWGRIESIFSSPLSLTKPEVQIAPSGLVLKP